MCHDEIQSKAKLISVGSANRSSDKQHTWKCSYDDTNKYTLIHTEKNKYIQRKGVNADTCRDDEDQMLTAAG